MIKLETEINVFSSNTLMRLVFSSKTQCCQKKVTIKPLIRVKIKVELSERL